jgi:hypothetical protein
MYKEVFGPAPLRNGADVCAGTRSTHSLQLTRRSNQSWLGDEDADLSDPFAEIDDDFDFGEDIEANLLRDKRATLCANVSRLIEKLEPGAGAAGFPALRETCDELLALLENSPEMGLEGHFVAGHGMMA